MGRMSRLGSVIFLSRGISMSNYDFLILNHNEFECLTRDLLQKKEGCFVESFAEGRDGV